MAAGSGHIYEGHQQQPAKQGYPYSTKSKNQQLTLSDEDEPGIIFTAENSAADADDEKRKMCPWQRMKWTDAMVKLLITVVYYIGDEVGLSEGNADPSGKKKSGGGMLQKKGKWKSVSRAMMERGFYVSPQQCEDKFNDLNKRYKRVNDILGKGTACRVVENQSLLETMDHLSPKMKEEVKKLLNSKHLFFREMCAYHNSCSASASAGAGAGAAASGSSAAHQSTEMIAADPSQTHEKQRCLDSLENASHRPNSDGDGREDDNEDCNDFEIDDSEDDEEEEDEEEEEVELEGSARSHEDERGGKSSRRKRKGMFISPSIQKLSSDLMVVVQDGTRSPGEKRKWMRVQMMQLEEQRVGYESQAFELEKQWLKWRKFSSKKEREMERENLQNEQTRLENERMVLLLRQKELELIDLQQQECPNKE